MQLATSTRVFLGLLVLCVWAPQALGTEKYSIAANASAVVVGELSDVKKWPSLRGWRVTGKIRIISELYAKDSLPRTLSFNFICSCCPLWPPPETSFLTGTPGLWFLIPSPDGGWMSAGSCSDPGWRPIQDQGKFEDFFKGRRR